MPLDHPADALTDFVNRLDSASIDYMLTGSVAGYWYGLNRSTADTDIVVDLRPSQVPRLMLAFGEGWYIDRGMIDEALRLQRMFNVISHRGGKFDLIPLKQDLFERGMFIRRVKQDWHGTSIWVCTAEDLVLSKLAWARESESQRQFADVRAIMSSGFVDEHSDYFEHWIDALRLRSTLAASREARYDA